MIDIFNLPNNDSNIDIFTNINGGGNTAWQTWVKPKNVKFIHILVIGAGGGGGAGWSSSFNSGGGGGGGGTGGITSGFYPANVLPNTLYIQVGTGGLGGRTNRGDNGTSGTASFISINAGSAATDRILYANP
jgi:hypothetical protein